MTLLATLALLAAVTAVAWVTLAGRPSDPVPTPSSVTSAAVPTKTAAPKATAASAPTTTASGPTLAQEVRRIVGPVTRSQLALNATLDGLTSPSSRAGSAAVGRLARVITVAQGQAAALRLGRKGTDGQIVDALSSALRSHASWITRVQAALDSAPVYAEAIRPALAPATAARSGYDRLSGLLKASSAPGSTSSVDLAGRSVDDGRGALAAAQLRVGARPTPPPLTITVPVTTTVPSPAPASSASTRVSCDRAPGVLYERFTGTTTDRAISFDVRICLDGTTWYYGSTDSNGGGVSGIRAEQVGSSEWRSVSGTYRVFETAAGLGCVSVYSSGVQERGYPACGPVTYRASG